MAWTTNTVLSLAWTGQRRIRRRSGTTRPRTRSSDTSRSSRTYSSATTPARGRWGSAAPDSSILLAELALREHLHGQGLGAELVVRALDTVIDAARVAGGKLVIVDARDAGAEAFYWHHDCQPLPDRNDRLVMNSAPRHARSRKVGLVREPDWCIGRRAI